MKTTINVPSGIQYLSDVEEIRTVYNNDLPPNAIIDKQLTGCYPPDTEFFTGVGWKKLKDYQQGDKVLQFNKATRKAELAEPLKYIVEDTDQFYELKNRRYSFITSEKHKHLVTSKQSKDFLYKDFTTSQLYEKFHKTETGVGSYKLTNYFNYEGGSGIPFSDLEIRLQVAIMADGYVRYIRQSDGYAYICIAVKKDRKKERLEYLLNNLDVKYVKKNLPWRPGKTTYCFHWFCSDKIFTDYWYSCTQAQFKIICDEVFYWDGYHNPRDETRKPSKSYSTAVKSNADFIQFALASIGVQSTITVDNRLDKGKPNLYYDLRVLHNEGYTLSVNRTSDSSLTFTKVNNISSQMYCFTVPSGYFIVRQNDKIFVSGNCGGTTLALRNKENYVIAVQTIKLVKGKSETEEGVFGFYGETTDTELREYLKTGNKIITTYDSVPRVVSVLGSRVSEFRLLVDEYHRMIAYMDNFKVGVCLALLENTYKFKSVSYMTATPTDLDWLPEPLKKLEYIKFDWENKTYPDLKHCYVDYNINEKVLSVILDKLNNTEEELYIFYNSRKGVSSIVKLLFKCMSHLTLNDINILFSDTDKNTQYFKRHLGKSFQYGEIPNGTNNKRLNFISSMCYEGTDFFPNTEVVDGVCLKTPTTLVVSNPNSITMRFDIQTDLTQIAGRFRRHKVLGKFVPNPIIYIWNTQKVDYIKDKHKYLKDLQEEKEQSIDFLEQGKKNPKILRALKTIVSEGKDKFIINSEVSDDIVPMLHPYAIEVSMNNFEAFHNVSCVIGNLDDDENLAENSKVVTKLVELSPNLSTYKIPELNSLYTRALGRRASVDKMLREYKELIKNLHEANIREDSFSISYFSNLLEEWLQVNSEFDEWLDAGITPENMNTAGKDRNRINQLAETSRKLAGHSEALLYELNLKEGSSYTNKELKAKIQEYYDRNNIDRKAKGTDISQWYETCKTSKKENGKPISAIRIIKKL